MEYTTRIEQLLPHAPPMVLIDSIIEHSDAHIVCQTNSHLDGDNPLRSDGVMSVFVGIEYAAQAMAIHTRLCSQGASPNTPRKGVIAVASKLTAHTQQLDDFPQPLQVRTDIIAQTADSSLCSFAISAGAQTVLEGQLTALVMDD
ncbi:hypothetical protein QWI17_18375 [Gilvimarinus sp. SDUM040013]|uniref:3-hydroxylacyl-ACP dehydratase n=1 Tax=Gilvimarinus gilvus TaxID=3058038 RepID=A0ABU4S1L3_9GAMM|nr:hypothetical protein [Gilvimarinus sp. SDUM040013]MDO3387816.1 hypothetical protein [Gilvimarinus sp. SDUM040013]MDX6851041.1 hypothetical protein [Gilvimarinus sp. SDUM040013]